MKTVVVTVAIDAAPELVFAAATDLPRASERISGIKQVEMLSDGPFGVGTRWRETRTMFGRDATEEMWVTDVDAPHAYAVEANSHGSRYLTRVDVEPLEGGRARLSMRFTAEPQSFAAKVLSRVLPGMRKMVTKCLQDDLNDIKSWCEHAGAPNDASR